MKAGPDRRYTPEFRDAAVKQVIEGGRSVAAVARSLEMSNKSLANWVYRARKGQQLVKPALAQPVSELEAVVAKASRSGVLRASFRPGHDIAALRACLRLRERHLDYAAAHIQHMQKALTFMNLQLHHVVSDITGVTGMKIIRAILGGQRDPQVLATTRDVRCKASIDTVRAALVGNYQAEHVFALTQALALYAFYQARVGECDVEIERTLAVLNADKECPSEPLPRPRNKTQQPQRGEFRYPPASLSTHRGGPDADPRHWPLPRAADDRRVRNGPEPMANGQALHVVANVGAGMQNKRRQGCALTRLRVLRVCADSTLRLAAVTVGRTNTAWARSIVDWPPASASPRP